MSWHDHPNASRIVADHWQDAECFIIAQRNPCIEIRDAEVKHIDRFMHGGFPDDLSAWKRPRFWFVAVVLCPGDDTTALAEYVVKNRLDANRFHFYLHPDTPRDVLVGWRDADLPLDRVDDEGKKGRPLDSWDALHGILGVHFNGQIVADIL